MLLNSPFESQDVKSLNADIVIMATGSQPDGKAFQRALPEHDALPGIDRGNVWSAEDVMGWAARLGHTVIVLDETSNWKGGGTALLLAEAGHAVVVVTGAPNVMSEMARTNADVQLRARLRQLGVRIFTETVMLEWQGEGATIQTSGALSQQIAADSLVVAATNIAEHSLADELGAPTIGDATAARNAAMAIYEGRKRAMEI